LRSGARARLSDRDGAHHARRGPRRGGRRARRRAVRPARSAPARARGAMSSAWTRFRSRPGARPGLHAPVALAAVAAAADLVASDLPLAARVEGRLYLLPCLTRPAALVDDDIQTLAARAAWQLPTPIPYGPLASRPGGAQLPLDPPSRRHP